MLADYVLSLWPLLVLSLAYWWLVPYFWTNRALKRIPSPFPASFTNFWLLYQCRRGRRFKAVNDAHQKLGPLVRIQPNHISIADADAIQVIYGHGNGLLKRFASLLSIAQLPNRFSSEYYDAFVSIRRGLFNTRDRAEHARKRKTVSHTFSAKSVTQFEEYININLQKFVKQWDNISARATNGGYNKIDCLPWFNYVAFDIIGDLAFGAPFGMLERGKDMAEVCLTPDSPPTYAPAIQVLNRRGEVSATLGCLPALKPWAKTLPDPFFRNGLAAVESLAGIATARVKERLAQTKVERVDLLARLMEGRDDKGEKLSREELTAEALTQLIAGSDTTSNTSCA
jgi:benzoate 4-monooxygenase